MNISVIVKTNAKKDEVSFIKDVYYVYTKSQAKEGKANASVISLLSQYLDVPKSNMKILIGFKCNKKVIEIL